MTETDHTSDSSDTTLAERIEAARLRSNELAANATNRAREFVHEHPVATIAGGIAVGALIAGALSRRKKRKAAVETPTAATLDATTARLTRLAALGADLALRYATRAAAAGKDGVGRIEEHIGEQLGHLEGVGEKGAGVAEAVLAKLREAGESALHRLIQRKHD
jgi:ElaB/YqjD/DUF883 family membrane-anchored ribosome-binding protein